MHATILLNFGELAEVRMTRRTSEKTVRTQFKAFACFEIVRSSN
jgi:hypothetical protein